MARSLSTIHSVIGEETLKHVERKPLHFLEIEGRPDIGLILRTAQQHHVQLSVMADTKASILITVSSIVMTIALSRSSDPQLRAALLTLAVACLFSLVLAIWAVLPTFSKGAGSRNLLFFGHFAMMSEVEFLQALEQLVSSEGKTYETAARDLYSLGMYLYQKKYRFLRFAYISLLSGFIIATVVELYVVFSRSFP
jgi:hypothetical protein